MFAFFSIFLLLVLLFVFFKFYNMSQLLQLLGEMLKLCFAVKLLFPAGHQTSPVFGSRVSG